MEARRQGRKEWRKGGRKEKVLEKNTVYEYKYNNQAGRNNRNYAFIQGSGEWGGVGETELILVPGFFCIPQGSQTVYTLTLEYYGSFFLFKQFTRGMIFFYFP